jgi:hypothetical protein
VNLWVAWGLTGTLLFAGLAGTLLILYAMPAKNDGDVIPGRIRRTDEQQGAKARLGR